MEQSIVFADQWELEQQQQQQMLTAAAALGDAHNDFQLQNLANISAPSSDHHHHHLNSVLVMKPPWESSCNKINCCSDRPSKIPKTISWGSCEHELEGLNWRSYEMMIDHRDRQGMKRAASGAGLWPPHAHVDHVIAERKRREKLSQRFIALAAVIPGLTKADKASILGDAIKYVKELEQTLKSLQDQKAKKTVESVVLVKKSRPSSDANDTINDASVVDVSITSGVCSSSSISVNSDEFGSQLSGDLPPEIQVRISEKKVLVRIHCETEKGVFVKVLSEIEKLHLTVVNASAVPFVGSSIDITVTAQAEEGFSMTGNDLAKKMRSIFHQPNW